MKTSIGCAAFLFAASATSVGAQPPVLVEGSPAPTAQVSYSDLNLGSPSGIATLQGRVRRAAEGLCQTPGVRPLPERLATQQCVETAIAGAQSQVEQALAVYGTERFAARGAIAVRLSQ